MEQAKPVTVFKENTIKRSRALILFTWWPGIFDCNKDIAQKFYRFAYGLLFIMSELSANPSFT
jgi:hypothetical protein